MHAVSTNQIADILHYNDNDYFRTNSKNIETHEKSSIQLFP